ncbi:MAG: hypothetical protein HY350_04630 [Candidatus Omnitrophica bacterium]|nr:hypothetical protein [Candidatus Omnitrophota bacterium]
MPNKHKWLWGAQSDFIFKRRVAGVPGKGESAQYFLTGSYGLTDWFSFDGKIGTGNVSFGPDNSRRIDYDYGFAGGYGFRVKAYENEEKGICVITGFQHISVHPPSEYSGGDKYTVIWDEWQGSSIVAKRIKNTTVYLGPRFSEGGIIYKVSGNRRRLKPEERWGGILGIGYDKEKLVVYLEGRFGDEEGITGGIALKF